MALFTRRVPVGDNRERAVCNDCGFVSYENPKIVAGAVVISGDKVLMCRRAIEPRRGFWTLPAGYMELGETIEEAAVREAHEEAEALIHLDGVLGIFSVARIGQVQVIFRARFANPDAPEFRPGQESLEVGLFRWDEIPWNEIAFPTVVWALDAWNAVRDGPLGVPASNPPADLRGMHGLATMPNRQSERS